MTTEQQQRLQALLHDITRPIFVWRMAAAMVALGNPPQKAGATKRVDQALSEIDKLVREYVHATS